MTSASSPTPPPLADQQATLSPAAVWRRTVFLTTFFVAVLVVITLLGIAGWAYYQVTQLASAANQTPTQIWKLIQTGWREPVSQVSDKKNILILGVDQVANRGDDPLLTDTIMLASLNTKTGETHLLSLPRDLWLEDYLTKINALYFYGQERYPSRPEQFSEEVISNLTQVPLHHTVVLNLEQVATLIDTLGGIEVEVQTGFTDPEFPRDDVDIDTVTDPDLLYETVTFEPGRQLMSGELALKFIRSRHSGDDEGTDQARGARQQLVIEALIQKMLSRDTLLNPELVGKLLHLYQQTFDQFLPTTQLVAIGRQLTENRNQLKLEIHKDNLSVQTSTESGVITHPPLADTQNQWSYTVVNDEAFKKEVWQKLALPQNR